MRVSAIAYSESDLQIKITLGKRREPNLDCYDASGKMVQYDGRGVTIFRDHLK